MCRREDKSTLTTQMDDVNESPNQNELDFIASSINIDKLPRKKTLSIDENGIIDIDSTHENYKYWIE